MTAKWASRSASGTTTVARGSSKGCRRVAIGGSVLSSKPSGELGPAWTAGANTSPFEAWMRAAENGLAGSGVDVDWYTTRTRDEAEVLPWDHLDSGLDREWLWADWQDALDEVEVDDCRWTPCFDCGVCDQMGTEIQVGPTGVARPGAGAARPGLGFGVSRPGPDREYRHRSSAFACSTPNVGG